MRLLVVQWITIALIFVHCGVLYLTRHVPVEVALWLALITGLAGLGVQLAWAVADRITIRRMQERHNTARAILVAIGANTLAAQTTWHPYRTPARPRRWLGSLICVGVPLLIVALRLWRPLPALLLLLAISVGAAAFHVALRREDGAAVRAVRRHFAAWWAALIPPPR